MKYTGSLSGLGSVSYQPNGNFYYSAVTGYHSGWLQGPAGANFDLYLLRYNGFGWMVVASSANAGSNEQITYYGTPGNYLWQVVDRGGSGSYQFWLKRP